MVVVFGTNITSLVVEHSAIALVYHDTPELQESKEKSSSAGVEYIKGQPCNHGSIRRTEIQPLRLLADFWGRFAQKISF